MGPISGEFGSQFVGVNLPTIFASFRSESACCWNCSILQKQPAGFVLMLSPGPAFQDLRQLFQLRLGGPGPGRGACALGSCKARMATGSTRHRRFESLNLYHLWGYGRGPRRDNRRTLKKNPFRVYHPQEDHGRKDNIRLSCCLPAGNSLPKKVTFRVAKHKYRA